MGEAKRRNDEIRRWLASLETPEREIASAALLAQQRIIADKGMVGGCYLLAFFLARYLDENHGIAVKPVVGWVNDGTSPFMSSHAWIESGGKITDIALTLTENPDAAPPGALMILGRPVRAGQVEYTYHTERPQEAIDLLRELDARMPGVVQIKETEHSNMHVVSTDKSLMRAFLDGAPPGHRYSDLARLLA